MSQKRVRDSDHQRYVGEVQGRGVCGMDSGFKVAAFSDGAVRLAQPITLNCPAIAEVETWISQSLQPAAQARFGQPVVGLVQTGGYNCRAMTGSTRGKLSEHAFGNAIDIGGFRLADGRVIKVRTGWRSPDEQERAFLRDTLADGCEEFTTALGPGAPAHHDHFHLDLSNHGRTSQGAKRYCNPKPPAERAPLPTLKGRDEIPDAAEFEQDVDASPQMEPPSSGGPVTALALSAPPALPMRAPVRAAEQSEPDELVEADPEPTGSLRAAAKAKSQDKVKLQDKAKLQDKTKVEDKTKVQDKAKLQNKAAPRGEAKSQNKTRPKVDIEAQTRTRARESAKTAPKAASRARAKDES